MLAVNDGLLRLMLASSRARILAQLADDALVLDVGGGASPLPRADWVIDVMAYEDRGLYGPAIDPESERFDPTTWVQRDVCDREPWPFDDGQFAFSVCSHTLEDVRDPVWVCDELIRVSRAGYIEVPSRLEEQSYGFQGPWAGWGHHRWLIEATGDGGLEFVFPTGFRDALPEQERVVSLWWDQPFPHRERIMLDAPSLDGYLARFVAAHGPVRRGLRERLRRVR
jgi:hypothetical protein